MIHFVRLAARAGATEAQRALERARASDVALILPLGMGAALGEGDELRRLADYCAAQGKRIVLIGGDQALRARAVAEGFAVATSLEEWETGKQRAVRPVRRLLGMRRGRVTRVLPDLPELPDLRPVAASPALEEDSGALYAIGGDDPPEYVAEIAASDGALAGPERHSQVPTIPLRPSRRAQRLEAAARERREAEALLHTSQRYEEQLTSAIRAGSGAGYAPPSAPAGWQPAARDEAGEDKAGDLSS